MISQRLARVRRASVPSTLRTLRLAWTLLVLWLELGPYFMSTLSCRWPDEQNQHASPQAPARVLLVADPQVLDAHSYPDRHPSVTALSQLIVDLQLRKAWRAALATRPDIVVFMGDMMDNGRAERGEAEYRKYVAKFKRMFADPTKRRIPRHYIPGNHDVWLGGDDPLSKLARARYLVNFGPLNSYASAGNHSLVFIDAPDLVEAASAQARAGVHIDAAHWLPDPLRDLQRVARLSSRAGGQQNPSVLFTHIPLWRAAGTECGPDRERGVLKEGRGFGYVNTLEPAVSRALLETFRPTLVFSGDDHDYCEVTHSLPASDDTAFGQSHKTVTEVTVKSLSMAMGIARPGFSLLSLSSSGAAHAMCLLPNQIRIYVWGYLPAYLLTVLLLFVHAARRGPASPFTSSQQEPLPLNGISRGPNAGFCRHTHKGSSLSGANAQPLACLRAPRTVQRWTHALERTTLGRFILDFAAVAWLPVLVFSLLVTYILW